MKLGVSYILFDGVELLGRSISQIRRHVDFVQVIYQSRSWFGAKAPSDTMKILNQLKATGKIDLLTEFSNFTPLKDKSSRSIVAAKSYERKKRQVGLNTCRKKGMTHFLCMDVDEFYVQSEFLAAKNLIIDENLNATAARFINYVNLPTLHRGYDSNYVPFICRITGNAEMGKRFFQRVDPTRGVMNTGSKAKMYAFKPAELTMHHMETVRRDLILKYNATTRSIFNRDRTKELVNNIKSVNEQSGSFNFNKIIFPRSGDMKLTQVPNRFKINYEKW
jgi:hypothetical protein